jgi:hypothetical protein
VELENRIVSGDLVPRRNHNASNYSSTTKSRLS